MTRNLSFQDRPAAAAFEVYIIQMIEEARKAGNVAEAFSSARADVCATSLESIASSCVGKAFLGRAKKDKGYEIRRDVALVDDPVLRGGAPFQHGHQDPADDGVGGKQCEEVSTGFDVLMNHHCKSNNTKICQGYFNKCCIV